MYRKKEIIIIVVIIIVSIFLAFLPKMLSKQSEEEVIQKEESQIQITIVGEINVDSLTLDLPRGVSYGYIINKAKLYLNDYSIVSNEFNKRYYENSTIEIASSDNKSELTDDTIGKININTASYQELIGLYGIGEKRANKIIDYRKQDRIKSFDELKKIIGVSDAVIQAIKEKAFL